MRGGFLAVVLGPVLVVACASEGPSEAERLDRFMTALDAGQDCRALFELGNDIAAGSPELAQAELALVDIGCVSVDSQRTDVADPADAEATMTGLEESLAALETVDDSALDRFDLARYGGTEGTDPCEELREATLTERSLIPVEEAPAPGCGVERGRWSDGWTGEVLEDAAAVVVTRLIPLEEADRTGAWRWSDATRLAFAGDRTDARQLRVVSVDTAEGRDALGSDRWRPPSGRRWCQYAADWIGVKARWQLGVTSAERSRLEQMLDACSGESIELVEAPDVVIEVTTVPPTTVTEAPSTVSPVTEAPVAETSAPGEDAGSTPPGASVTSGTAG